MKNILATLLLCSLSSINAQTVSDYKYVVVPQSFNDFENNQYGLNNRLRFNLEQKNYVVLSDDQTTWPTEVKTNPCLASTANLVKLKSMLKNKLEVQFTNCYKANVGSFEGTSQIKEFDKGYQEAIKFALAKLTLQKAKDVAPVLEAEKPQVVTTTAYTPEPKGREIAATNLLTDGTSTYQKAELQNGGFMLMSENGNQVVAKFEPTLKSGIYRVIVTKGNANYFSVGYISGNTISYEISDNNSWREVKLSTK